MKLQLSSQNFKLTPANESYIEKSMRKYLKIGQRIENISYKFKNHPAKKSYLSKFSGELIVSLAKTKIVIKKSGDDLYDLIELLAEIAEREIRKLKEKRIDLRQKGFLRGKALLRSLWSKVR